MWYIAVSPKWPLEQKLYKSRFISVINKYKDMQYEEVIVLS
jgi:hypothetical protein